MDTQTFDAVVVGAGPAGLAAACAARGCGLNRVLVLDREEYVGGVLPQCVHDGFGLHLYGRSLTGPEYALCWQQKAHDVGINPALETTVLGISRLGDSDYLVDAVGAPIGGHVDIRTHAVIIATGCRERTRGQLGIPGTRPAGVLTAGSAQYMVNVRNQLPGDKVVILGSGDVGLIMARRLMLEGADVRMVLGQKATGLLRNHLRCIRDFNIPFRYGWGVASIHGLGRLKGVTIAPVDEDGTFDLASHEYIRCNTLLIACGLIPEREVLAGLCADGEIDTTGDAARGLFICGNASAPHDLVDQVTQEALCAGRDAATYVCERQGRKPNVLPEDLRYLCEISVSEPHGRLGEDVDSVDETSQGATQVLVCTVCPTGCVLQVDSRGNVEGNGCARGIKFVRDELACPMRLFTGTVKIAGSARRLLAVRTAGEIPREDLISVARACARIVAHAPIKAGDIIKTNVANTGVDLISSESIDALTDAEETCA